MSQKYDAIFKLWKICMGGGSDDRRVAALCIKYLNIKDMFSYIVDTWGGNLQYFKSACQFVLDNGCTPSPRCLTSDDELFKILVKRGFL